MTGLDTILEMTQSALKWTFYAATLFKKNQQQPGGTLYISFLVSTSDNLECKQVGDELKMSSGAE